MTYTVGVDIGGTFTDCVAVEESGNVTSGKALSTPEDFAVGAINSLRDAASKLAFDDERGLLERTRLFFHGCTVADNTLLTRSGPKTGLVATSGFGDTVLMMRGRITQGLTEIEAAHVAALEKPDPMVPRRLIAEVPERIDYKGMVIVPLDVVEAMRAIDDLVEKKGVTSLAISLLWSISNDVHEQKLADLIKAKYPWVFATMSSEVAPFLGEYERTITTVFNAYVGPTISEYLGNLQRVLQDRGLKREPLIMQAYGGVLSIAASRKNAVGLIESAPTAGIAGSAFQGALIERSDIIVTDMGGTTFKVGVIRDGKIERDYNPVFARYDILSPKIWVESIGAGGGSVAWVDNTSNLIKVGPQGAGSKPGPVCYGAGGTEPTVSDADLVLGYLNEDYFLGGRVRLDKAAAVEAIRTKIAAPMEMDVMTAASAIFRITNAHMSDLIHRSTVERGYDPRGFVLFAIGGAAPVHAGRYAAELGIGEVVVPYTGAVQGAMGLISSDVAYEYGKSDRIEFPGNLKRINDNFSGLLKRAYDDLRAAGFADSDMTMQRSLDMRYRYQTHELNAPLRPGRDPLTDDDLTQAGSLFDDLYEQSYGKDAGYRAAGKEIVAFRVRAQGRLPRPRLEKKLPAATPAAPARHSVRPVFFEENGDYISTDVYRFETIAPGVEIRGPAIIESPVTTIVVTPAYRAVMDAYRNIRLSIGAK